MKKLSLFIGLMLLLSIGFTQTQEEMVSVPKSQLTAQQLAEIEMKNQVQKIESYGKWVGVGDEIGAAVRESLLGVVDVADKFGSTNVGKFTLVMVAWKIIGKDLVRIVLGVLFIALFTLLIFRIYRNLYVPRKIRKTGAWWKFWEKSEYEIITPDDNWEGYVFVKILFLFLYAGAFGLTYAIMFA